MNENLMAARDALAKKRDALDVAVQELDLLMRDPIDNSKSPIAKRKPGKEHPRRAGATANTANGIIEAVRGLAEPFTAADLLASGVVKDRQAATNFFTRAKAKKWVASAGYGKYVRTKKFGVGAAAPSAKEIEYRKLREDVKVPEIHRTIGNAE
jgi:hypothetical protein